MRMTPEQFEQHQRRIKGGESHPTKSGDLTTGAAHPRKRGMNKWEREYADHLQREGSWYAYELFKLRLATGAWYKPDFAVLNIDQLEFHEVKGHRREASIVRIKVAAELFPFPFYLVTKEDGRWVQRRV